MLASKSVVNDAIVDCMKRTTLNECFFQIWINVEIYVEQNVTGRHDSEP